MYRNDTRPTYVYTVFQISYIVVYKTEIWLTKHTYVLYIVVYKTEIWLTIDTYVLYIIAYKTEIWLTLHTNALYIVVRVYKTETLIEWLFFILLQPNFVCTFFKTS